jgi:protocatechuate 3,4-dioxygenase beta subunit
MRPTRRSALASLLAIAPAALLRHGVSVAAEPRALAPTPACGEDPGATPAQTAGPYYRPSAPARRDLRGDRPAGAPFTVAGYVVDARCRGIAGALVEIWHADEAGRYDNEGFLLRATQRTDAAGRWGFDTILTRHYAGRTAHYHFRVSRPQGRALVTQLYFPDEPRNAADPIFDARLLMRLDAARRLGRFDFVVA